MSNFKNHYSTLVCNFRTQSAFLCGQVEVNVSRDPSRLYKLTAGWEQRKKEGPGPSGHGASLHMPHR